MKDAKGHGSSSRGSYTSQDINANGQPYTKINVRPGDNRDNYRGMNDAAAAHQEGVNSLARGLHVDWANAKNPYSGGGFASQARARRTDKATAYIAQRAGRASNFKLTGG